MPLNKIIKAMAKLETENTRLKEAVSETSAALNETKSVEVIAWFNFRVLHN